MKQPKFEIGDRVTYASPKLPYQKNRGIGKVVWEMVSHYYIVWENFPEMECPHLKEWELGEDDMLMLVKTEILPEKLAGHGKNKKHIQPPLPIVVASDSKTLPEIPKPKAKKPKSKPSLLEGLKVGDRVRNLENGTIGVVTYLSPIAINIEDDECVQGYSLEFGSPRLEILTHPNEAVVFAIGDRVTLASKNCDFGKFGMGATVLGKRWDKRKKITWMTVQFDDGSIASNHVEGSGWFKLLETPKIDSLPEIAARDLHGYFEHYQPVIKGAKSYWYRRYVYVDISGKLRHHHVPNKQVESIESLWRSGATAKEICLALGKTYSTKNSS